MDSVRAVNRVPEFAVYRTMGSRQGRMALAPYYPAIIILVDAVLVRSGASGRPRDKLISIIG